MTRLSVNINKVATLRNARGGNVPNVVKVALDCESFGADGITVHPRPDERHIRKSDVYDLRPLLRTEFNIEGYPAPEFIDLVLKVKPHQVTLVPDSPTQLTSNSGLGYESQSGVSDRSAGSVQYRRYPYVGIRVYRCGNDRVCRQSRCRPGGTLYRTLCYGIP